MDRKRPEEETQKRNGKILSTGSSASKGIAPGRSSSYGLSRLLRQYKEKEHLAFHQAELMGTIDIVPLMSVSYGQPRVEFKIGGKRKYVLKNIMTFANAMRRGDLVSYGKALEFYHIPEVFTKRGRTLAEFLVMTAADRNRNRHAINYYGHENRYVQIHSGNMDEFFQAVGTEEFQVETNYSSWQSCRVSDEWYQPVLTVRGQELSLIHI